MPGLPPAVPSASRSDVPSLSVVIPAKDDAVALDRCLRLVARQTHAPLEVVVVDNGSTDATARVAAAHGARVVPEPRPGIPAAAATGYDAARGDVVVRCDADSAPPPDWLARVAARMSADPTLDALTGTGYFYDLPRWAEPVLRRAYLGSYYALVHLALAHTALWGSNLAFRRATWHEVRHLVHRDDAELHDDIDLAFQLGPARRTAYDGALRVGVSARSLRGGAQLRRRFRRAFRTLAVNWRVEPPWERWRRRLE
ncbi:glycosyltransferase family 2 protein [Cellulomonas fimi]|uniref:4,4'-diaponeurosporenoate glycosyltransferase n=1 Tax=Cellulomonas fimi TaxID=1708 RepID=A0A7Y0LVT0_CELFI|nr:glycosyltransferase family 2 protein [Cellulomonas fimi]